MLVIPVVIDTSWTVLVLDGGFAALLLLGTHALGMLQGVHGVDRGVGGVLGTRPPRGDLLLVFDVHDGSYLTYAIPVARGACADAMGAIVGRRWGRHRYEVVPGHFRSVEGSTAFFVVALACITVPLTLGAGGRSVRALVVGGARVAPRHGVRSVSVHGLDYLLVPWAPCSSSSITSPCRGPGWACRHW